MDPYTREKVVPLTGGRQPAGLPEYIAPAETLSQFGGLDDWTFNVEDVLGAAPGSNLSFEGGQAAA